MTFKGRALPGFVAAAFMAVALMQVSALIAQGIPPGGIPPQQPRPPAGGPPPPPPDNFALQNATVFGGPFTFAGKKHDSARDFLNALITNSPFYSETLSIYLPAPVTFPPPLGGPGDNRFIKVGFLFLDRPSLTQELGSLDILTPAIFPNADGQGNLEADSDRKDGIFPSLQVLDFLESLDALPGFGGGIVYKNREPRFTGGWKPIAQDATTIILAYYCSPRPGLGVRPLSGLPAFPPFVEDPEKRDPSVLKFAPANLQSLTILRPAPSFNLPSNLFRGFPYRELSFAELEIDTRDQSFNFFGITAPSFLLWRSSPPVRYLGLDTETIAKQLYQRSLAPPQ